MKKLSKKFDEDICLRSRNHTNKLSMYGIYVGVVMFVSLANGEFDTIDEFSFTMAQVQYQKNITLTFEI